MNDVKYFLELTPDINSLTFTGKLKTNANNLDLKNIQILHSDYKYIIQGEKLIHESKSYINLVFQGIINTDGTGLYRTTYLYNGKRVHGLATQLEPIYARSLFPCIDDPSVKATFQLKINIKKEYFDDKLVVLSNTKCKMIDGMQYIFESTPLMSTYLVALFVGHAEKISDKYKNIEINVYTNVNKTHEGKFALDVTKKGLLFYENYFGIEYVLDKLDLVGVSDFNEAAMENWGLILFRYNMLIFDRKDTPIDVIITNTCVILHELAHQWFGNLVTMKTWNDLWLNEGLTTWISHKAADYLFPEWKIWNIFCMNDYHHALSTDMLNTSHSIEITDEIDKITSDEAFNNITYTKGCIIMRMLEQYIGEEKIKKGMQQYCKKYKYSNATTCDLWNIFNVSELMSTWTKIKGFPILFVYKQPNGIFVEQKHINNLDHIFHIPLFFSNGEVVLMKDKQIKIDKYDIVNNNNINFMVVYYGEELNINKYSAINISNIIGDLFFLAMCNKISVSIPLKLIDEVKNREFIVVEKFIKYLQHIKNLCYQNKKITEYVDDKINKLLLKTSNNTSFENTLFNKMIMKFSKNTKIGNIEEQIASPDYKKENYIIKIKNIDEKEYMNLLDKCINDDSDTQYILESLGHVHKIELLMELFNAVFEKFRFQNICSALKTVCDNHLGKQLLLYYLITHYDKICKCPNINVVGKNISVILKNITTEHELDIFKKFIENNYTVNMIIKQTFEMVENNIKFKKHIEKEII